MRILLSNDDGYRAEGLTCLAHELKPHAEITIVAPDRNRSGASNSLTLDSPIRLREESTDVYAVDGTPTDCVHLAITGLLKRQPDMVISGINAGANLGDDVLYSGTVAAAMEGRFLGFPAIAVSLASENPTLFATAAKVTVKVIDLLRRDPLPADTILNINVPECEYDELGGFEATRLGHRHRSAPVIKDTDPRGRPLYWIGPAGPEQDAGPGTDFNAISRQCVSITPMQVDLTRYAALDKIAGWLTGLDS